MRTAGILFSAVTAFFVFSSCLEASEVNIDAHSLEYDDENKYLVATGSVTVIWQDKKLIAEKVQFWMKTNYLHAEGYVSLNDGNSVLYGDAITYDYNAGKGQVNRASGYSEPWYFAAEMAEKKGEKLYETQRIAITTCNLKKPHYTIRAKKAKITLDKRIVVYNALFYFRNVPIVYFPVLVNSMGAHRDSLQIEPGYDPDDGLILKVIYGYPLSASTYGKLYLDSFGRRGIGKGLEFNYAYADRIKGTLYGYHIKENTIQNERWTLRGSHWQMLDRQWTMQSEIDFLSDTTFNNLYFQENWQRTDQRLRSYVSFTRQGVSNNSRTVLERTDVFNAASGKFEPQTIALPRITYTQFPRRTPWHFYTNLNLTMQNEYNSANGYYTISGTGDTSITDDYRLGRKLTLTPRLGVTENWQNRTSAVDYGSIFTTRYNSNLNLRYRLARWVDWDLAHTYRLRSEVNSLLPDTSAIDYGEESNQVSWVNSMYISRKMTLRNSTAYSFQHFRNEGAVDWRQKFTPLVNELTWMPHFSYFLYLREENSIYPFTLNSVQTDMRWEGKADRYLNLGVFYRSIQPDQMNFTTGIGFWPSRNWRIDYTVRTTTLNNFGEIRLNDQELKLYRDLHCWEFKLTYRRRLMVDEIYFQLELKSSAKNREKQPLAKDKEFYPWR